MSAVPIDFTPIIIHVIGILASYWFGKRRGRASRKIPPLSEKDLPIMDRQ